ncbi:MAG: ComEC/Rec2 family competence protein [Candidatus Paceibacterota bacterium]
MVFIRKNLNWLILGILVLVNAFIWFAVLKEDRGGQLRVYFLNIGQGDAILIDAPSGNQMLIDGGPDKSVLSELGKVLPFYDHKIEVVLATHPDQDHVAGLNYVLDRYRVDQVLEPGVSAETAVYQNLEKKIGDKKISKILARRGMIVDLGGGAVFKILFPDRDTIGWETNTASIVGRVVYGGNSVMLTGDSPQAIENYLTILDGKNLQSDVLKAGHHGSRTSSSQSFVGFVNPQYAVISAGKNNSYGHPHQEVLDLLKKFQVQILRTDELGMIKFSSDGGLWSLD